jgi:Arc/MetJ-type ribon-helix-helix transcriptional regulator
MMREFRKTAGIAVVALALVGCGGVKSVPVSPPPPSPVKTMLEDVAKTGELGSGAEAIRTGLTEMKSSNAAVADELLKELDQLEKLQDPAKLKAKAKAMADKI